MASSSRQTPPPPRATLDIAPRPVDPGNLAASPNKCLHSAEIYALQTLASSCWLIAYFTRLRVEWLTIFEDRLLGGKRIRAVRAGKLADCGRSRSACRAYGCPFFFGLGQRVEMNGGGDVRTSCATALARQFAAE